MSIIGSPCTSQAQTEIGVHSFIQELSVIKIMFLGSGL